MRKMPSCGEFDTESRAAAERRKYGWLRDPSRDIIQYSLGEKKRRVKTKYISGSQQPFNEALENSPLVIGVTLFTTGSKQYQR